MSKSFKFSLHRVLKFQSDKEDLKATDLSKSKQQLKLERDRLKRLQNKKSDHLGRTETLINGDNSISLEKLRASADYLSQLNEKISSQNQKVQKSNHEVEKARKDLIEVSKNRKILEKLKEKQYQDYKEKSKKEERRKESEIALRRKTRNNDIKD